MSAKRRAFKRAVEKTLREQCGYVPERLDWFFDATRKQWGVRAVRHFAERGPSAVYMIAEKSWPT